MRLPLINRTVPPADAPRAPFVRLSPLWIQITGTWCNPHEYTFAKTSMVRSRGNL